MGALKQPKQLEAIVFYSKQDNCYIAHSVECDQLGTGDNKEQAIEDLGTGLKNLYDLCNKDETLDFYAETTPEKIQQALQKAKSNPEKYNPIVHKVPKYFNINNYFFDEDLFED